MERQGVYFWCFIKAAYFNNKRIYFLTTLPLRQIIFKPHELFNSDVSFITLHSFALELYCSDRCCVIKFITLIPFFIMKICSCCLSKTAGHAQGTISFAASCNVHNNNLASSLSKEGDQRLTEHKQTKTECAKL